MTTTISKTQKASISTLTKQRNLFNRLVDQIRDAITPVVSGRYMGLPEEGRPKLSTEVKILYENVNHLRAVDQNLIKNDTAVFSIPKVGCRKVTISPTVAGKFLFNVAFNLDNDGQLQPTIITDVHEKEIQEMIPTFIKWFFGKKPESAFSQKNLEAEIKIMGLTVK